MTGTSLYAALALGFVLGLRHALDADHLAAVSTLVSQHRSLARSCLLGTFWGLGHTLALLAAGVAALALRLTISPDVEARLEKGVGCMLVALGAHVLLRSLAMPAPRHSHDNPDDDHTHLLRLAGRPFVVGVVHGMAGSAALTVLVAAAIPSALGGLLYILVFGIGSAVGMLTLSGLIGLPFVVAANRSPRALASIQAVAGVVSVVLGLTLLGAPPVSAMPIGAGRDPGVA
jgi:sulfite exporter TauE/SafE